MMIVIFTVLLLQNLSEVKISKMPSKLIWKIKILGFATLQTFPVFICLEALFAVWSSNNLQQQGLGRVLIHMAYWKSWSSGVKISFDVLDF